MTELLIVSAIFNLFILFNLSKISKLVNIYDLPDNRLKKHNFKTPLLGGLILFLNISIFIVYIFFSGNFFYEDLFSINSISINLFFILFFILGIVDDKYKLLPGKKFLFTLLISIIVLNLNDRMVIEKLSFSFTDSKFYLKNFSFFFTVFCIIILINSLNFYDGINGQSIIFFLLIFTYLFFKSPMALFYIFIVFVLIFLLTLNIREKIFMGDSGIYFLGSILIVSLIYEYNKFQTIFYSDEIFLLLMLPGFDLLRLTITRIWKGQNPLYGDRNHIHHLLIKKLSLYRTNFILLLLHFSPIFIYSFLKINFLIILIFFTSAYILIIYKFYQIKG